LRSKGRDAPNSDVVPLESWPTNEPKTTERLQQEYEAATNPVTRAVLREIIRKRGNN